MDGVKREILTKTIKHYGSGNQIFKAMEECAELIRALARYDDPDNIAEEMADVKIMLGQLEIIMDNREAVRIWELRKLRRLDKLVHAADEVG